MATYNGTAGNDSLIGGVGADILNGLVGNDTLNGGAGADVMAGGAGNDTYIVDNVGDVVTELAGQGTDTVNASVSYALSADVENLVLTGSAAINGTGNALGNNLTGNAGNNVLDGGLAADTMAGGLGDDVYYVDVAQDVVTELAVQGTDVVYASVGYALSANVENLVLGGTAAINGTGNDLANAITGNAGNNVLDGGRGADAMAGGAGNDTYVVDDAGDSVAEAAGAGTDVVNAVISYTLSANVENLVLTGTAAINGTGNGLANNLTGNIGNNTLDGGVGADTMLGGQGNDTYVVDNGGDVVTEGAGQGTDTVNASVSYALTTNVENLTLTGSAAINGTGNGLANVLTGNGAVNTLNGGVGADNMAGGAGDDVYYVDNAQDVVVESAGEGADLIWSSVTYTLAANVESLTLTGSAAINGSGNGADNTLTGNGLNNTLNGGAGNDTLTGGAGSDIFAFNTAANGASNVDTITDFVSGTDKLVLSKAIFSAISGTAGQTLAAASYYTDGALLSIGGDVLLYDGNSGALSYDADGAGVGAAVQIALLGAGSSHPAITVADLMLAA